MVIDAVVYFVVFLFHLDMYNKLTYAAYDPIGDSSTEH